MNVLLAIIKISGVKHTNKYTNKLYNEHPNRDSMLGLSEMFSQYKIENLGIRAKNKEEDIFKLEPPFVAHVGSDFVAVSKISNENVTYLRNGKKIVVRIQEFIKTWSGLALLIEPSEESIEINYKENRKKEVFEKFLKVWLGLALMILALIVFIKNDIYKNVGLILLTTINAIGVYIGYLLIQKQLHVQDSYADKICSFFSKEGCNYILKSSTSKFLGVIGWSELGLGYFISNLFIILLLPTLLPFLTLLNICVLPYSFWSVWFQKFKSKQWCPLCLAVQMLFWCIFVVDIIFGYMKLPDFTLENILLAAVIYSIPFLAICKLLPRLVEAQKIEQITQELNSLKMNKEVFSTLLLKQPHYNVDETTSSILFGNSEASTLITIFTNPHCEPCAKMHNRIEELLKVYSDKLRIQYVFSSFSEGLDISNKYLIAVYQQKPNDEMITIYHKWFTGSKSQKKELFNLFPVEIENNIVLEEFNKHKHWSNTTKLSYTPTILLNGYKVPNNYKIEDLIYFTDLVIDSK